VRPLTDERRDRASLAERLAERDDAVLTKWVDRGDVPYEELRATLARQSRAGLVHPVFLGSAITGSGVDAVLGAIPELLPVAQGDANRDVAARAFKIERGPSGDRLAYLRLFDGRIRVRDRVTYGDGEGRITSLAVFGPGGAVSAPAAGPGQIARVAGLSGIRVGDVVGALEVDAEERQFPPPALEAVVVPRSAAARGRLRAALGELAEYDPLINVRQDDDRGEIAVSLYGEVQKDVIAETLARDHGVEVDFRETTTVCIERPAGIAEVLEVLRSPTKTNISGKSSPDSENPYAATLGLRLEPAAVGTGIDVRLDVDVQLVPMYVFNTVTSFREHMAAYVRAALAEGLFGWPVTDCVVTVFDSGYFRTGSTAGDFRKLTSLVLAKALERAGTIVCEPMTAVRIDAPSASGSGIVHVLLTTGSRILGQFSAADRTTITALVQAARVHEVQNRLPGLTGGEGVLEASFGGYHAVIADPPPARRRTAAQLVAGGRDG
jgi:ribosomal protection tetracycline resistance protein